MLATVFSVQLHIHILAPQPTYIILSYNNRTHAVYVVLHNFKKKHTSIHSIQAIVNDHEHYFLAKVAKYAHKPSMHRSQVTIV